MSRSTMRNAVAASLLAGAAVAGWQGPARAQNADLSEADRSFLVKDARGAAYELQSAKLAVQKAARQDVKDYAAKLVRDHETYNTALEQLGKKQGLTLPTDFDATDKAHMQDLERLSGKAFDDLYIKEAMRINADDERDSAKEKASTKVQAIKDFMAEFEGMDKDHEKLAQKLAKSDG